MHPNVSLCVWRAKLVFELRLVSVVWTLLNSL